MIYFTIRLLALLLVIGSAELLDTDNYVRRSLNRKERHW